MGNLISSIESVQILLEELIASRTLPAVISPGSRNAPISVSMKRSGLFKCHVMLDERSAGFFALGIAQEVGIAILVCTSGSAMLNYGPAIAEAHYQHIPLIVISADRAPEWLGQLDGQVIPQQGILSAFFKHECQLPANISCDDERWHARRSIQDAISAAKHPLGGPVHINVPLREPLYEFTCPMRPKINLMPPMTVQSTLANFCIGHIQYTYRKAKKVMVVVGPYLNKELGNTLMELKTDYDIIIVGEHLSNLPCDCGIRHIDRVLATITPEEKEKFTPDLVIACGGAVLSRQLKKFLREAKNKQVWYVGEGEMAPDTFQGLASHIPIPPESFFPQFIHTPTSPKLPTQFRQVWLSKAKEAEGRHDTFFKDLSWCDLKAFSIISAHIPADSEVQLGNSTPIRYMELFALPNLHRAWGNRGTNGIEGSLSVAMGAASYSRKTVTLVIGDNSFLYDSNALLSGNYPKNLKIIVIDNGGGGIFRFLPGSSSLDEVQELFEVPHHLDLSKLAELHGIQMLTADDETSLQDALQKLYASEDMTMLIVNTSTRANGEILKQYFQYLSKQ